MSWDIFSKSKIQYFLQKLKDKFVQKEAGKGLSTNDFTNEDKALIGQTLGNNTVLTTDKTPFLTRQTLNPTGFSGYVREKLVGASYAWNQLITNGNFSNRTTDWTIVSRLTSSVSANVLTITVNTVGDIYADAFYTGIMGHKYLIIAKVKQASTTSGTFGLRAFYNGTANYETVYGIKDGAWHTFAVIISENTGGLSNRLRIFEQSAALNDTAQVCDCQCIDLTLAFGSTIADHLYSLANNGGITKLRDMGCPIDKYTPYGYGLYSVKTSEKKIVGFNVVDFKYANSYVEGPYRMLDVPFADTTQMYMTLADNDTSVSVSEVSIGFYKDSTHYNWVFQNGAMKTRHSNVSTADNNTLCPRIFIYPNTEAAFNKIIARFKICVNFDTPTGNPKNGDYVPYSETTYPLGNDELRGKFDLVNGEIVASGDVKESNGKITRVRKRIELNTLTYTYDSSNQRFISTTTISDIGGDSTGGYYNNIICSKYVNKFANEDKVCFIYSNKNLYIYDYAYTDPTAFKNSLASVYLEYELATPTTEQSTPFADPMSLVGATTEEYIDTRDIPCPVGAERQYMGQSEDIIEIPSSPQSDGKRVLISEVSGGKEQVYWDIPKLYYKEYTVTGDGTKTYGDLLAELKPYYEALSEDEKTYSKVMMRATSSGNECLAFVGNYWYSRMGVNASGLWLDQIDFQLNKYFKQVSGGSISDYTNTSAAYNVIALRVLTYTRAES